MIYSLATAVLYLFTAYVVVASLALTWVGITRIPDALAMLPEKVAINVLIGAGGAFIIGLGSILMQLTL